MDIKLLEGLAIAISLVCLVILMAIERHLDALTKDIAKIDYKLSIGHDAEGNPVPVINPAANKRSTNIFRNKKRIIEERRKM